MKEKLNNIKEKIYNAFDDYVEDAKTFWLLLKDRVNKDFNNPRMQKKYVTLAAVLLVVTILIANILTSFSYYYEESDNVNIIDTSVGDLYINDYDYTLLVFLETQANTGIYELAPEIPSAGYTYNGYKCLNDATLLYNDGEKSTTTTLDTKDVCSVYFNVAR